MKIKWTAVLSVLALSTSTTPTVDATRFLSPPSLAGKQFNTPAMEFSPSNFSINATLVKFNEEWCANSCQGPTDEELLQPQSTEPFALFFQDFFSAPCFNCGYGKLVLWASGVGASAILWADLEVAGQDVRLIHNFGEAKEAAATNVPLLFIGRADASTIRAALNESDAVPMAILEPSENPWIDMWDNGPWIVVQVICSLAALFVSMESLRKLLIFLLKKKNKGPGAAAANGGSCGGYLSLPVLCLTIEFIANSIRVINIAVDPLYSREVFPYAWARFLLTVTAPLSWVTTILLFLFWQDMVNMSKNLVASMKQRKKGGALFLSQRSKILFTASGFAVFSIDMAFTTAMAFFGRIQLLMINGAIFSVVNLVMAALFIVNGRYIGRFIKGSGGIVGAKDSVATSENHPAAPESTRGRAGSSLSSFSSAAGSSFARFKRKGKSPRSRQASEEKRRARQTNKKIYSMTRNMVAAAVCMIILVPVVAMAGIYSVMYDPNSRLVLWFFIWMSFVGVSFFKVRAFVPPEPTLLPKEFWERVYCKGESAGKDPDLEEAAYTSVGNNTQEYPSSPTKLGGEKGGEHVQHSFQSRPYAATSVSLHSHASMGGSFTNGANDYHGNASVASQRTQQHRGTALEAATDKVLNACRKVGTNIRHSLARGEKYAASPTPEKPKLKQKPYALLGGRKISFGDTLTTWNRRRGKGEELRIVASSPRDSDFV